MRWVFLFLLTIAVAQACVVPESGMVVSESVAMCNSAHSAEAIQVIGENITVNCQGAILKGAYAGEGFRVSGENITIKDCRMINFETAFLVMNASRVFLLDNHVVRSMVGSSLIGVDDSVVYNRDVTLETPVYVRKSKNNIVSSMNRFVQGAFCEHNYCNRNRNVIETFMEPKNDAHEFSEWFSYRLDPRAQLQRWLYVSLAGG